MKCKIQTLTTESCKEFKTLRAEREVLAKTVDKLGLACNAKQFKFENSGAKVREHSRPAQDAVCQIKSRIGIMVYGIVWFASQQTNNEG